MGKRTCINRSIVLANPPFNSQNKALSTRRIHLHRAPQPLFVILNGIDGTLTNTAVYSQHTASLITQRNNLKCINMALKFHKQSAIQFKSCNGNQSAGRQVNRQTQIRKDKLHGLSWFSFRGNCRKKHFFQLLQLLQPQTRRLVTLRIELLESNNITQPLSHRAARHSHYNGQNSSSCYRRAICNSV